MDEEQRQAFERAVERRKEEARVRSHATGWPPRTDPARPDQQTLQTHPRQQIADDQPQDTFSVRAKNTGHGKKTADKWNQ